MIDGWGVWVEADFQYVIVVRSDTETGDEAVYVQVQVLADYALTLRESFAVWGWVEKKRLKLDKITFEPSRVKINYMYLDF